MHACGHDGHTAVAITLAEILAARHARAVVDLDVMDGNIARIATACRERGGAWRPHTKGQKVPAIAHKLLAAGAIGVTCQKLGEAEVMAAAGIRDILVANQIVGDQKITRLVNLLRHADVVVAVDDPENVAALDAAARAKGVRLRVVIEVDIGGHRAGVEPGVVSCAPLPDQGGANATRRSPKNWRASALPSVGKFGRERLLIMITIGGGSTS